MHEPRHSGGRYLRFAHALRYARSRRLHVLALSLLALAVMEAMWGSIGLVLPTARTGDVDVPFRRELPLAYAALAVSSLHGPMEGLEAVAAGSLQQMRALHLITAAVLSGVVVGVLEGRHGGVAVGVVAVRALVVWLGIAVLSGLCMGWALGWVLPLATVFPLSYFGSSADPQWWDWSRGAPGDTAANLMAVAAVLLVVVGLLSTPWRRRRRSPRRRGAV